MDKKIVIVFLLLSGCVSANSVITTPQVASTVLAPISTIVQNSDTTDNTLTNIRYVYIGMTQKEVETIMGNYLTIGHQIEDTLTNNFKPITLNAPYRKEVLKRRKKTYDVHYYFTQIRKTDGLIAEDELMPLIFEKDILIGKGHDFFFRLTNE